MNRILSALLLILSSTVFLKAQERLETPDDETNRLQLRQADSLDELRPRHSSIRLIARTSADSVVLRWAPTKAGGWRTANALGYIVEKQVIPKDEAAPLPAFQRLTPQPLKPWTLDEWKSRSRPDQKYAAIAAQVLYGRSSVSNPTGTGSIEALRNAADELSNKFSFALFAADVDPHAANGLALRLVDRDVKIGDQIIYRVFTAVQDPTYSLDTAYHVVDVAAAITIPPPPDVRAIELDSSIIIQWNQLPGADFTGFYVFKSASENGNYEQITSTPVVPMTPEGARERQQPQYRDTNVINYRKYFYQVRGITPFGELSEPATISAMGRDLTPPPIPLLKNLEQTGRSSVRLEWEITDENRDVAGYLIAKSPSPTEGFEQVTLQQLPSSAREFTDNSATSNEPYYMVAAVDTAGNVSPSLVGFATIIDSLPPSPPIGLRGSIDTNGIVTLTWSLGFEKDLIGYRVLWANDSTHEFSQRTPDVFKDTVFTDTIQIKTLTRHIYYRVVSVDDRLNHSDFSKTLELRRPDIVPPEASVFTDVIATDSSVILRWAHSTSSDLASQRLLRRVKNSGEWTQLALLGNRAGEYQDRTVARNTMYEYSLQAIDSSGLQSEQATPVQARPYDTGLRPGVTGFAGRFDAENSTAILTWQYTPNFTEDYWFVVYRSGSIAPVIQFRAVEKSLKEFRDNSVVKGTTYRYAVRVMTTNGGESMLSNEVSISVP